MSTDAHFLAAIAAAPADRLPRLVYADWLDECGDVRGELIRLEEETRERVAWDDTLWKLKPRRNELRQQVPADWLKAMDYAQHCEPLFRGQPFPTDVRDAWRLIREAVTRWSHCDTGWDMPFGEWGEEVAAVERRLGLTLPASVQEFIRFAHDFKDPDSTADIQLYSSRVGIEPLPHADALSLLHDMYSHDGQQADGVLLRHLRLPDPPVYRFEREGDEHTRPERWSGSSGAISQTVTDFIFHRVHETVGGDAGRVTL
jgi:uncharacterized protein (TIGR02996 family)